MYLLSARSSVCCGGAAIVLAATSVVTPMASAIALVWSSSNALMPAADLGSIASTTAWIERRYEIASVSAIVPLACAMSLRAARASET